MFGGNLSSAAKGGREGHLRGSEAEAHNRTPAAERRRAAAAAAAAGMLKIGGVSCVVRSRPRRNHLACAGGRGVHRCR